MTTEGEALGLMCDLASVRLDRMRMEALGPYSPTGACRVEPPEWLLGALAGGQARCLGRDGIPPTQGQVEEEVENWMLAETDLALIELVDAEIARLRNPERLPQ